MGQIGFVKLTLAYPVETKTKEHGARLSPGHPILENGCLVMAVLNEGKVDAKALESTLDYVVRYETELSKLSGGRLLFPNMGTRISKTIARKLKNTSLSIAIAGNKDLLVTDDDGLDGPEMFEGSDFD